jgi:hypothetical protein
MDGIYLIVLIGFAVMSAALLKICAALGPNSSDGAGLVGQHDRMLAKDRAADRVL